MSKVDVAAVLAAHRSLIQVGQAKACTCGWEDGFDPDVTTAHIAHVVSILREQIDSAVADGWDEGNRAGYADAVFDDRGFPDDADAGDHPHANPYR